MTRLIQAFEQMGGIAYIFLTHEDDVGDSHKYARQFGAKRLIHRADLEAAPDAEWIIDGHVPIQAAPQFKIVPVPGHTPGSMILLFDDTFLFTGDHLWWDPEGYSLEAPQQLVWSKSHLLESIAKLMRLRFEWVLAGHGDRIHLSNAEMQAHLKALLERRGGHSTMGSVGL